MLIHIITVSLIYTIGVFTGVFVMRSMQKEFEKRGLDGARPSRADAKKIITLAKQKNKLTNNDVEKLLGVSDATATRYLDSLEQQDTLIQHGKTGRSVYYTVK